LDKNLYENLKKLDFDAKKEDNPFAVLGKYVPVHKYDENNSSSKTTSPIEKQKKEHSKLNICDNDYLIYKYFDEYNINGKKFTLWKFLKFLVLNLPLINVFFLKFKESKIRKTIETLDDMSSDIGIYSKFLRNSAVIQKPDFKNSHKNFIG